jgi:acyl-homoserine lactone acylase PvdQ
MSKTATKEKPPKKLVRSTKGANNGVNGRPTWQPAIQTFRANGLTGTETQEQAWERTRNWVRHCASIGIQCEVIATLVQPPCSHDTLVKYFKHELQNGKQHQTALIAAKLVQQAMNGDGHSQRFWLETQAGWSRKVDVNQNGVLVIRTISGDEDE